MKISGVYNEHQDRIIRLPKEITIIALTLENEELRRYRDEHILYVNDCANTLEIYKDKITELKAELIHCKKVNKNG